MRIYLNPWSACAPILTKAPKQLMRHSDRSSMTRWADDSWDKSPERTKHVHCLLIHWKWILSDVRINCARKSRRKQLKNHENEENRLKMDLKFVTISASLKILRHQVIRHQTCRLVAHRCRTWVSVARVRCATCDRVSTTLGTSWWDYLCDQIMFDLIRIDLMIEWIVMRVYKKQN